MSEQRRCPVCNEWYDPKDERTNRPRRFCSRACAGVRGNVMRWDPPPAMQAMRWRNGSFWQHLLPL